MVSAKKPTDLLKEDHQNVLKKLDSLDEMIGNLDQKDKVAAPLKEVSSFFQTDFWVHFDKEEQALFPELEKFIPRESGPLGVMLAEHEDLRKTNADFQRTVSEYLGGADNPETMGEIQQQGSHFITVLRDHIFKEDNILFSMADAHLDQHQMDKVAELFLKIDGGHVLEGKQERGVIEMLRGRRSCKDFLDTPVSPEILSELVDIARYSPSGANKNTWRFIIITERQTLDRLSETARTCSWLNSAQAAIAVVIDPLSTRYWLEDCSVAAYSIWLAAEARGLGAAWAAMHQGDKPEESVRRQKHVREILSIPDELAVPMVIGLGYRKSPPAERERPALEEIINWESYPIL
ncbi:MAG: nitroreductase family protein [Dehalococcoidales bacterium]|nr:nitroreductase family protein [Dehalococcoidales bacterium]